MNGLRRALLLGSTRLWGRPFPGPVCRGRRRRGSSAWPGQAAAGGLRRWDTAAHEEEEEFVFPEYLPEEAAAAARPQPAPVEVDARPRGAEEEDEPAPSDRRRPLQPARRRKKPAGGGEGHKVAGRPDPSVPSSGVSCSGCGAELHCRDPVVPGYLPSEKYLSLLLGRPQGEEGGRGGPSRERPSREPQALLESGPAVCQRCWLLVHHRRALRVQMSREDYRSLVSSALRRPPRHGRPPLVLCLVDLLDLPDSLVPDLPELVGSQAHVFVLGNKVDLLPGDSAGYLKRLREQLMETCAQAGLVDLTQAGSSSSSTGRQQQRVVDVHLISAKTGYGVEELISRLQRSWKFNGDVYLVGATNTGKSTLFNALLYSDYCKSRASDAINRATISPWPGTTLNLLKFPIINPTPYRIFRREARLIADAAKTEEDLSEHEQKQLTMLKKQSYLIGRIGRTFQQPKKLEKNYEIEFDAEALSFSMEEDPSLPSKTATKKVELTYNEVKDARWFYDTPGIVKDGCVLNLLNEKEIKLVLPTYAIVPRTFILKPGMTLFLGALGRIDYLQGDQPSWFSVVASNLLPVHITTVEKAGAVYQKHAGQTLLKVPMGGEERMKVFPSLVPQDMLLEGIGEDEAVADIKLSSAGWVAVTAHSSNKMHLRCYTPEGTMLTVRKPPLLPYLIHIKGHRMKGSSAYQTKRPPALVENLKANGNQKKGLKCKKL